VTFSSPFAPRLFEVESSASFAETPETLSRAATKPNTLMSSQIEWLDSKHPLRLNELRSSLQRFRAFPYLNRIAKSV
jgi:hypothetical protein